MIVQEYENSVDVYLKGLFVIFAFPYFSIPNKNYIYCIKYIFGYFMHYFIQEMCTSVKIQYKEKLTIWQSLWWYVFEYNSFIRLHKGYPLVATDCNILPREGNLMLSTFRSFLKEHIRQLILSTWWFAFVFVLTYLIFTP